MDDSEEQATKALRTQRNDKTHVFPDFSDSSRRSEERRECIK
jgi:hypothetical protein